MNLLVISNDDKTWLLPAWSNFESGFNPENKLHFVLLPDRLKNFNKIHAIAWSFNVFGWKQSMLLSFFSGLKVILNLKSSKVITKKALKMSSVNVGQILDYIKRHEIDLVVITCSYIIPAELLEKSQVPWINKHSSLLPNCRGLFPFIWGRIHGFPAGVTYHLVNEQVDQGEPLLQKIIQDKSTLVDFYSQVYSDFAEDCRLAIEIAVGKIQRSLVSETGPDIYFSLPKKVDLKAFYSNGGKIIEFKDFALLYK